MATMQLLTDSEVEAKPTVKAVFDDIRATRKSDFVNNFWRGLANDPALLKRTWEGLKAVMMAEGALDPLVREMIYIAVSTANGCAYCIHSHTAAARARGMTDCAARRAHRGYRIGRPDESSRHSNANSGRCGVSGLRGKTAPARILHGSRGRIDSGVVS